MEPLNPPTDNLYKFIAIAGLLLMFFGLSAPSWYLITARSKITDLSIEVRTIELEIHFLEEDLQRLTGKSIDQIGKSELSPEQTAKLREILLKQVRLNETLKLEEWKARSMILAMLVLGVTTFFGSWMARKGFSLWYDRLQVFQDAIIKDEAIAIKNRVASETTQDSEDEKKSVSPKR
ncbi:MAG: hypothetical protein HONDAALG_04661 [Gammaproteobacteria bacterium]|nr:hypothetical protein [Gammaproteobacteria bacterium]